MQLAVNRVNTPTARIKSAAKHTTTIKSGDADDGILAVEKTQAMQQLIKITHSLVDLAERESQALAQNDMISFSILQDEKALIAEHYAKASEEFRSRLPEFQGMNPALIDRLDSMQRRLGEASRQNNAAVERIYNQSKENTQSTLISAQELGQKKPLRHDNMNISDEEAQQHA